MGKTATEETRYWFCSCSCRLKNPHADRAWKPFSFVSTGHPLNLCRKSWRDDDTFERELVSWQEITKEEYELYKELNP